jgi:hypothetical protein
MVQAARHPFRFDEQHAIERSDGRGRSVARALQPRSRLPASEVLMLESGFVPVRISRRVTLLSQPGPVAQLAEQQTLNLRVLGSIPSWLTNFPNNS